MWLRLHVEDDERIPKAELDHAAVLREMAVRSISRSAGTGIGIFLDDQLRNALFNAEEVSTGGSTGQSDVCSVACLLVYLPKRMDLVNGVPLAGFSHNGAV